MERCAVMCSERDSDIGRGVCQCFLARVSKCKADLVDERGKRADNCSRYLYLTFMFWFYAVGGATLLALCTEYSQVNVLCIR